MRYSHTTDKSFNYLITNKDNKLRIDKFLAREVKTHSRSFLKKILDDNNFVTVNNKNTKPSYKLKTGDKIQLNIPELIEMSAEAENIPLTILYEDTDIIVINKQPNLVVHPAPGHETGTLVNALLYHCKELSGIGEEFFRPGIVHRLDRDTSGCMVAAKTDQAHRELVEQFAARTTQKKYLAITHSTPVPSEGKIEGYIARSQTNYKKMALYTAGGKYSLTYYKTLEKFTNFALIECDIKTGRTHQIRLHLKSLGCPLICDRDYGKEAEISYNQLLGKKKDSTIILNRQALHAAELSFNHPISKQRISFKASLPADMQNVLNLLKEDKS